MSERCENTTMNVMILCPAVCMYISDVVNKLEWVVKLSNLSRVYLFLFFFANEWTSMAAPCGAQIWRKKHKKHSPNPSKVLPLYTDRIRSKHIKSLKECYLYDYLLLIEQPHEGDRCNNGRVFVTVTMICLLFVSTYVCLVLYQHCL